MEQRDPIRRVFLEGDDGRLCCVDFGGTGRPMLLLHGLAGRGNEWRETASWLTAHGHVVALDQRGHGMSDRPADGNYSRDAYVGDARAAIERLGLAPALLIGQSMGGLNALLAAARWPDLVRALIVIEATPGANPSAQRDARKWLEGWPAPFPTLADARMFFGGDTLYAQTWLEVLEEHAEGYRPQFSTEDMVRSMEDITQRDYWREWEGVRCPTLIAGGERSWIAQDDLREMARRVPRARYVQIAAAGHDPHLEQPEAWRQAAEEFLRELDGNGGEVE